MENTASSIENLFEKTEVYSKTTYELSKLKLLETTTLLVTTLVTRMAVILMIGLFVVVFNIGVAMLIGEWFVQTYVGFFIVAGFYLVIGLIFHFFLYQWIKKPISDLIIHQSLQ